MYPKDTTCGVADIDTLRTINVMTDWTERAAKRMKDLDLRQEDLMEAFGVTTRGAVGHYFRKRREPSADQLIAVARRLNMGVGELVAGEPVPNDQSQVLPLDFETLRTAIVATKEAYANFGREVEIFEAAPLIWYAYVERAAMPRFMSSIQLDEFDAMVSARLEELQEHERAKRPHVKIGVKSPAPSKAVKKTVGNRK